MQPKGYILLHSSVKPVLPHRIRHQAKTRIDELFRPAGGLRAQYSNASLDSIKANLTDGIVEVYLDSRQATQGFRSNVYRRLHAFGLSIPSLKPLAVKFQQANYRVHEGRSYTVKGLFSEGPNMPDLVCFSYGVVSLNAAFAIWRGLLSLGKNDPYASRKKWTLATIKHAPAAEQLSFGIALGNLIAHELRHQLGLSDNGVGLVPEHTNAGLGKDGANFRDPKITFSDAGAILASLATLQALQLSALHRTGRL